MSVSPKTQPNKPIRVRATIETNTETNMEVASLILRLRTNIVVEKAKATMEATKPSIPAAISPEESAVII